MQARWNPRYAGHLITLLLITLLISTTVIARPFVLALSQDDLKDGPVDDTSDDPNSVADLDEFGEPDDRSDDELDPGTWRPIFEPDELNYGDSFETNPNLEEYYSSVRKIVFAVSDGGRSIDDVAAEIEATAATGNPQAQSLLLFTSNFVV
ncbi:ERAD-associated E3 ubiquitin-protein ligase component HRD3A-like [Rutidosis leptorrhynchoides]|uniref:ERAD-associated E3 ubiquitin-protein ligase component HRD3A-like n=1 Tax=Rutidosis leptorrhynchoides TaxID=125765 RepID=UPI003A991F9A